MPPQWRGSRPSSKLCNIFSKVMPVLSRTSGRRLGSLTVCCKFGLGAGRLGARQATLRIRLREVSQVAASVTTFHGGANLETLLGEQNAEVPESAASIVIYLQEVEKRCTTVSTMHTADLPAY